jgi:O-acetyl-ADP-ribose deacetylase (regulator of RNase III)
MSSFFEGRLVVEVGDITRLKADAIVNAANSALLGGGGVDGAIHRAGGPAILQACQEIRKNRLPDGLPAGEAVETTAGRLPARYVIHTVGPVWHGGGSGEESTLAGCYEKSLQIAERRGLRSVAFPAISTGIYGFPRDKAARVVWKVFTEWFPAHSLPRTVTLEFYAEEDARIFLSAADTKP